MDNAIQREDKIRDEINSFWKAMKEQYGIKCLPKIKKFIDYCQVYGASLYFKYGGQLVYIKTKEKKWQFDGIYFANYMTIDEFKEILNVPIKQF